MRPHDAEHRLLKVRRLRERLPADAHRHVESAFLLLGDTEVSQDVQLLLLREALVRFALEDGLDAAAGRGQTLRMLHHALGGRGDLAQPALALFVHHWEVGLHRILVFSFDRSKRSCRYVE